MTKSSKSFGLVAKWDQEREKLMATGDSKIVRVWDLKTEMKIGDWPVGHDCLVTSIDIHRCGEPIVLMVHKTFEIVFFVTFQHIFLNCRTESSLSGFGRRSRTLDRRSFTTIRVRCCDLARI